MSIAKRAISGSAEAPPEMLQFRMLTMREVLLAIEAMPKFHTMVTELPGNCVQEVFHAMQQEQKDECTRAVAEAINNLLAELESCEAYERGDVYVKHLPTILTNSIALALAHGQLPDLHLPNAPVVNWIPPANN